MASGVIKLILNNSGKPLEGEIDWFSKSNGTVENTSTVTVQLWFHRTNDATTTGVWTGELKINGTSFTYNSNRGVSKGWVKALEKTVTVSHDSKTGEGKCSIYGWIQGPNQTSLEGTWIQTPGGASNPTQVTLDKIPRAAYITSAPKSFTDEENPIIYYKNPAGSSNQSMSVLMTFYNTYQDKICEYISIPIKESGSYTFNLDTLKASNGDSLRIYIQKQCSNTKKRTVYFYIHSEIGGNLYFDEYASSEVSIANAKPIVTPTISVDATTKQVTYPSENTLIKNFSYLTLDMSVKAQKYANIVDKQIKYNSQWHNAENIPLELQHITDNSINFWAKDSRGNETYAGEKIYTIIDYQKPQCTIELGTPNPKGSIDLIIRGYCWQGNFSTAYKNEIDVQYLVKDEGSAIATAAAPPWTRIPTPTVNKNGTFSTKVTISNLDYKKRYSVRAWVGDTLYQRESDTGGAYSEARVFTCRPIFDWSGDDFNFNIPVNVPEITVNKKSLKQMISDIIYPVGSIYTTITPLKNSIPTEDPNHPNNLFGGTWVQFAQGRTLMGVDPYQNGFKYAEYKDGEKTHILTTDEMPKHNHRVMNNGNNNNAGAWTTKEYIWSGSTPDNTNGAYGNTGNDNNKLTTSYVGSGNAHNNLPPYITVYFWKRTK